MEILLLGIFLETMNIKARLLITKKKFKAKRNCSIRLKFPNLLLDSTIPHQPLRLTIKPSTKRKILTNPKMMIHSIDPKQLKNGVITTQTRKDFMELLRNSLNILRKVRRLNLSQFIKTFGSNYRVIQT